MFVDLLLSKHNHNGPAARRFLLVLGAELNERKMCTAALRHRCDNGKELVRVGVFCRGWWGGLRISVRVSVRTNGGSPVSPLVRSNSEDAGVNFPPCPPSIPFKKLYGTNIVVNSIANKLFIYTFCTCWKYAFFPYESFVIC